MSRGLCWGDNREQDVELRDTLQRAYVERLDSGTGHLRQESNQRNEHEQPFKSSQPNKSSKHDYNACSRASSRGDFVASRGANYNRGCTTDTNKTRNITIHDSGCSCPICREYDDYTAAISTKGQSISSRIWHSSEPRAFKQTDSTTTDPVERCTGIPTGVTI